MTQPCGCCEPLAPLTPLRVENRPGLSAIAYRIGAYASFRESMLNAIATTPELMALTTRRDDDYAITVLDLWAAVADVLTFYQERYANEVFLRTAKLPESLRRLARLIGYSPRPGAAATAALAFTVETHKMVKIPVGLRVQSLPAQDQLPQTFETLEAITAHARLNRLRIYPPPAAVTQPFAAHPQRAVLAPFKGPAIAAALAAGDTIVFFQAGATNPVEEKKIDSFVTEDDRVTLVVTTPVEAGWDLTADVYKFKRIFRQFGHNAPATYMKPSVNNKLAGGIQWSLTNTNYNQAQAFSISLDGRHDDIAVGTLILIADGAGLKTLARVMRVNQVQATRGPLSDTVTQLRFSKLIPATTDIRTRKIYELAGPRIEFSHFSYGQALTSATVYLPGRAVTGPKGPGVEVDRTVERNAFKPGVVLHPDDIEVGREVLLADSSGQPVAAKVAAVPTIDSSFAPLDHLVIPLQVAGNLQLQAASAILLGNIAAASHGESVKGEIVGSGDASRKFQQFKLKKKPLTYVPSAQPGGLANSLELLVNKVRWKEVTGLYGQAPTAQVYAVRTAEDGSSLLQFGDGVRGAVLPTGGNNVTANYRMGSGLAGRVSSGALTTLLDRLPGLSSVTNPQAAEGGADPETSQTTRQKAPGTVRTFGRAVSIEDFSDLATASGEVAKAQATWVWDGADRAIYLTVAGQQGALFSDQKLRQIGASLTAARDPNHRLIVANYHQAPILLSASVQVDPNQVQAEVGKAVRAAIVAALSFDSLTLGQAVHLSDIYRILQEVTGVSSLDVTQLMFKKPAGMSNFIFLIYLLLRGVTRLPNGQPDPVQGHLRIFPARHNPLQPGKVAPAELAVVESPAHDIAITLTGGL